MKAFLPSTILIFFLLLIAVCINGCWSYRELNQLAIIAGVGIDTEKKSDEVQLSVQIIKPSEVQSGGMDSGGGVAVKPKPPWWSKPKPSRML